MTILLNKLKTLKNNIIDGDMEKELDQCQEELSNISRHLLTDSKHSTPVSLVILADLFFTLQAVEAPGEVMNDLIT